MKQQLASSFMRVHTVIRSDFFMNAARQAIGAILFLLATTRLSTSLNSAGFSDYMLAWSGAQFLAAFLNFGIYNAVIKLLSIEKIGFGYLVYKSRLIIFLQFATVPLFVFAFGKILGFSFGSGSIFVVGLLLGNFFNAITLGLGVFRVFAVGELVQPVFFLTSVYFLDAPSVFIVSFAYFISVLMKAGTIIFLEPRFFLDFHSHDFEDEKAGIAGFAFKAYLQSVFSAAESRLAPFLFKLIVGEHVFQIFAPVWAIFDRLVSLVQGVNQITYPKVVRGQLAALDYTKIASFVFVVYAALTYGATFLLSFYSRYEFQLIFSNSGFALSGFFFGLVLWQFFLNFILAKEKFFDLFLSHVLVAVLMGLSGTVYALGNCAFSLIILSLAYMTVIVAWFVFRRKV